VNVEEAVKSFLLSMQGVRSPATIAWYKNRLSSLVAFVGAGTQLEHVTLEDLRRWRAALAERNVRWGANSSRPAVEGGLSSWTLYGHVKTARALFRWLVAESVLQKNIADRLELPHRSKIPRRGVDDKVADAIIAVARTGCERDYALIMFMAETACRVGGIAGLRVGDLDLENGRATVVEKGLGGHGLGRTVFFGKETAKAIRAWLKVRPASADDHVFLGVNGALRESGVYQCVERLARRAGIQGLGWNPHNWRHSAARSLLQRGASLAHVSQILGHSDIEVTARFYASFSVVELQDAFVRYSRYTTTIEMPAEVGHGPAV